MIEIVQNLFIGDDNDCFSYSNTHAVIHACKTCHQRAIGYRESLPSNHPHYLIYEDGNHLYLNMVDMERELLPVYTHPIMKAAFTFLDNYIEKKKILIHCNQGNSRSPSIGLLYLSRKSIISNDLYINAKNNFLNIYSIFNPGKGIELYMNNNWNEIINI